MHLTCYDQVICIDLVHSHSVECFWGLHYGQFEYQESESNQESESHHLLWETQL